MCGFKAEWQGGRRARSTLRLGSEFLVLAHHLSAQQLGTDNVYRRLSTLSVHQACELFQLRQHLRLDIPVIANLPEGSVKPWVLLYLYQGPHLPLPLNALVQSSPLNT